MVQYTVDAWGRSVPVQPGFTPAYRGPMGGPVTVGNTYNVGDGETSGTVGTNRAQANAAYSRALSQNNTPTRFNGRPISESNPGMIPWEYDAMNNPFAIQDPNSFDRKSAGLPGFIPGAGVLNPMLGWGVEDTPERAAERAYNQANPGQSTGLGNRYFGTGKWEPYHPLDVEHTQSVGKDRQGYGEYNTSGLGRDTNYDRFGKIRTEIPTDIAPGSAYWNSSTGAWTDKTTGVPLGGVINDPKSTPEAAKQAAIAKAKADDKAAKAKAKSNTDNRDKLSYRDVAIANANKAQLKEAAAATRAKADAKKYSGSVGDMKGSQGYTGSTGGSKSSSSAGGGGGK